MTWVRFVAPVVFCGCAPGGTVAVVDRDAPRDSGVDTALDTALDSGVDSGTPTPTWAYRQVAVTLVADHSTLVSHGLQAWPDSLIGFAHHPDGAVYGFGFGTDGDVMRATFSADGASITAGIRRQVGPTPPAGQWWGSGGPVYFDAASGQLLMVTHDEDRDVPDVSHGPHVSLRMAVSTDWGETWTDLGKIIDHAYLDGPNHAMGNGGFVSHEDGGETWLVVYHRDVQSPDLENQIAASRALLADVLDAAAARRTPVFYKWDGVSWTEPGLGGASVDLMADYSPQGFGVVGDIDPYWVPSVGRYVAFYPTQTDGSTYPPGWNVYHTWSDDGIHWTTPAVPLYPEDLIGGDPIYVGLDAHNRVLDDPTPALYRLRVTDDDDRWGSSTLERVDLELIQVE